MKKNLITTTLFLSLSAAALAEEQAAEQLEPIHVYSAYATPVNQDKTASAVTVLTEKDFAKRNATHVSDVLKTVPGAVLGSQGGRGALTSLFLRGANSAHTAVFIDGVRVNPFNSGFNFGGLPLSNVERIEVLRGEQSALWGSNAMGGVVYITTKSGLYKEKPFNVDFDIGTGSNGTLDSSATVSGYHDGFYYSLHGNSHRTKGISAISADRFTYQDQNGAQIVTGGAKEKDKFHSDSASLRVGYDKDNKGIDFLASHSSQTFHHDSPLATKDPNANRYFLTEATGQERSRARETLYKLSAYLGGDNDVYKHKASVSHLNLENDNFGANPSSADEKRFNANYQFDFNFDRKGNLHQALSFFGEYQKSNYNTSAYQNGKKAVTERSLAGEYRVFTESDHSLAFSGRVNDSSQYEKIVTGRVTGGYRFSDNFRGHASYGTAVRHPTFIELYGWNGTYIGNPDLRPEKSRGGDIGLLMQTDDRRYAFDVTYFVRNVRDYIDTNATWNGSINRKDTAKIRGIELDFNGKLTEALTAYANYTYTSIKSDKQADQYGANYLRRPKHLANAGVEYQVTEKLGTNLNVSYVGSRLDMFYGPYPYQSTVKLPSYTLVSTGVNYQVNKNVNLYANVNNLFDKKYENVLGYGQNGRHFYMGVKGSF